MSPYRAHRGRSFQTTLCSEQADYLLACSPARSASRIWSTGLLQLRSFPVRELKIDRIFVRDLLHNEGDRSLVRAVVDLAHRLSCRVVAEGVEDERVAQWLRAVGCDLAQGFHFQRPAPWTEQLHAVDPAAVPASTMSTR